jgi:hypothetical protein
MEVHMNLGKRLAISLLAGSSLLGIGIGAVKHDGAAALASEHAGEARADLRWRDGTSWHPPEWWRRNGHRASAGGWCDGDRVRALDWLLAGVDAEIKPSAAQADSWNGLAAAIRATGRDLDRWCAERSAMAETSALGQWAAAERALQWGTDAMAKVRPVFEAFYADLTDAQRRSVDRMIAHRRQG